MSERLYVQIDKRLRVEHFFYSFVSVCFLLSSVLDLNAFERQNKAEGLGMAMDGGSGTVFIWK